MTPTPRTDAMSAIIFDRKLCDADFARALERELAEAADFLQHWKDRYNIVEAQRDEKERQRAEAERLRFAADAGRRADRHALEKQLAAVTAERDAARTALDIECVHNGTAELRAERDAARAALEAWLKWTTTYNAAWPMKETLAALGKESQ